MKRTSRELKRRPGGAREATTVAIVCEGVKSEKIYFEGIRCQLRLPTVHMKVVGTGMDPRRLVEEAQSYREGYDSVWAVFDVEAPQPHPRLEEALDYARRQHIKTAVSNPCFELWLLLHFQDQTAYLDNKRVRDCLRRCDCGYLDKGFDFAKTWPLHPTAVHRARRLHDHQAGRDAKIADRNPWTSVHQLVEELVPIPRQRTDS